MVQARHLHLRDPASKPGASGRRGEGRERPETAEDEGSLRSGVAAEAAPAAAAVATAAEAPPECAARRLNAGRRERGRSALSAEGRAVAHAHGGGAGGGRAYLPVHGPRPFPTARRPRPLPAARTRTRTEARVSVDPPTCLHTGPAPFLPRADPDPPRAHAQDEDALSALLMRALRPANGERAL